MSDYTIQVNCICGHMQSVASDVQDFEPLECEQCGAKYKSFRAWLAVDHAMARAKDIGPMYQHIDVPVKGDGQGAFLCGLEEYIKAFSAFFPGEGGSLRLYELRDALQAAADKLTRQAEAIEPVLMEG